MSKLYTILRGAIRLLVLCSSIFFLPVNKVYAQPVLNFDTVATGLSFPVDVVNAGDGSDRLFIAQLNGIVRIYNGSTLLPTPFINLSGVTTENGEQGLLSIAFHPDYETNRNFYVYYTATGTGNLTLARYTADSENGDIADPGSGVILMSIPKPAGRGNHNGAKLNFRPDGYLYFATGDGGGAGDPDNLAQNGNSYMGKLLRINVTNVNTPPYYSIPADNPYVSNPAVLDEIYAMGLRNPFRWSFDRMNNDLWIADVGQDAWEEVNHIPAGTASGANFGWRCYESTHDYNTTGCQPIGNYTSPIFEYPHNNTTGGYSITGGFVYRGPDYPALDGFYICADYVSGNVWKIRPNGSGGWNTSIQTGLPGSVTSFGEAENGALYVLSSNGFLAQVQTNATLPVGLLNFNGKLYEGTVALTWKTATEQNSKEFEVEYSRDGTRFEYLGKVVSQNAPNGASYSYNHKLSFSGTAYYRLKMVDISGTWEYSNVIAIQANNITRNRVYPTIISNGMVSVELEGTFETIELITADGKTLVRQNINGRTGRIDITVPATAKGACIVKVQGRTEQFVQKVIVQ